MSPWVRAAPGDENLPVGKQRRLMIVSRLKQPARAPPTVRLWIPHLCLSRRVPRRPPPPTDDEHSSITQRCHREPSRAVNYWWRHCQQRAPMRHFDGPQGSTVALGQHNWRQYEGLALQKWHESPQRRLKGPRGKRKWQPPRVPHRRVPSVNGITEHSDDRAVGKASSGSIEPRTRSIGQLPRDSSLRSWRRSWLP